MAALGALGCGIIQKPYIDPGMYISTCSNPQALLQVLSDSKHMAETRIQVLSDLHLETGRSRRFHNLPLFINSGPARRYWIQQQLSNFRLVFFVLGNHEPYHSKWADAKSKLSRFGNDMRKGFLEGKIAGEFIILDQTRYDLSPSVTILGCTLFSGITPEQIQSVSYGLNDFYRIEDWSVDLHRRAHYADLN